METVDGRVRRGGLQRELRELADQLGLLDVT